MLLRSFWDVLFYIPYPQSTCAGDIASCVFECTRNATHQRGFAPPVCGDQTDAVTFGNRQVKIGEKWVTQGHAKGIVINDAH